MSIGKKYITSETQEIAVKLLLLERMRQDQKWGQQDHEDLYWLGILMEEVGEAAQVVIEAPVPRKGNKRDEDLDGELEQVGAVVLAWMECRIRRALQALCDGVQRGEICVGVEGEA